LDPSPIMNPSGKKQSGRFLIAALILPLGLLGCASTAQETKAPVLKEDMVVGNGTDDDRKVINASNQKIFESEHAESDPAMSPNVQN
jgi:hypothetical protein